MRSSETLSVVSGDLGCRGWKRSDFIGKPNRGVVCGRGREEGDGEPKNVILSFQAHLYFIYFLIPMRLHVSDLSWDTTWSPWTFDLGRVRGRWFPHAFLIPGDPTSMEKNGIWSPFLLTDPGGVSTLSRTLEATQQLQPWPWDTPVFKTFVSSQSKEIGVLQGGHWSHRVAVGCPGVPSGGSHMVCWIQVIWADSDSVTNYSGCSREMRCI